MIRLLSLLAIAGLLYSAHSFVPDGASGNSEVAGTALSFGFVLLSSFMVGRMVERFKLPRMTGYLLAGILLGPYALGLVTESMVAMLRLVDGVAICLIALTAGGELNFRRLRPLFKTLGGMVLWGVLGTAILLAVAIVLLRPMLPFLDHLGAVQLGAVAAMLGITLAAQSPAVVMALLSETASDGPLSKMMLAVVVLSDLVVVLLYAVCAALTQSLLGGDASVGRLTLSVAWELLGSMGVGMIVGAVLGLYLRKVRQGTPLFVFLTCIVVAEVSAQVHLDPLLVSLTAGLFLENITEVEASKLVHDIEDVSLPVYVLFFAVAGAIVDLGVLWVVAVPAGIISLVRGLGFWLGCGFAGRQSGAPKSVTRYAWIGLLPQAGLALALALLLKRSFPSFGDEASALILGVVAINQIVTPVLLRFALHVSGEAGKRDVQDDSEPQTVRLRPAQQRSASA